MQYFLNFDIFDLKYILYANIGKMNWIAVPEHDPIKFNKAENLGIKNAIENMSKLAKNLGIKLINFLFLAFYVIFLKKFKLSIIDRHG